MSTASVLAHVPLFMDLSEEQRQLIAQRMRTRRFRAGETIFYKDEPGSTLYIIVSGKVKIHALRGDGEEFIYDILGPNEFFGELSLFDGKERSADATAMEDTTTLLLEREHLLECIERNPHIAIHLLQVVGGRLRDADGLIQALTSLDVYGRVLKVLIDLAQEYGVDTERGRSIALNLTQSDLAGYVGSTRETVNKALSYYRKKGYLNVVRRQILIRDLRALQTELAKRWAS
ncbi:MAG: Crp/Fnr family transcriptional regulator [Abditibacteriales bacterium]|nr:Crp/Fnr family transcriptional regulator [Abditibacteriales bacterium]MDW8366929.1 Crp/Fnr family transcriptional regulator [Abditibacteriales bacterium]